MANGTVTSVRELLSKFEDEFIIIEKEVDPIDEIAGIQQALQDSYALLFTNVKGFPDVRIIGNAFSRSERVARMFDVKEFRELKFKCREAMKNPLPPQIVTDAPCQEVVHDIQEVDLPSMLPVIRHTPDDSARVFGGGIMLVTGPVARNGSDLSFKRMHFRGKDWATIWMGPHEHVTDLFLSEFRGEKVPVTINIAPPPSTLLVAAASFVHTIVPYGSDELGFAGALQGAPVEIVKAKTVDAYAIANAEVVIEGYLTPERVWETSEAEEKGPFADREEAPDFFPEWHGYMGKTLRVFKFQATAMTHREDPIFFTPHARSLEADILTAPFREACFLELFDRLAPGLVTDVNVMPGVASWAAFVIFQIKKRWPREEGLQKLLLSACFQHPILQLAIVVDDDVDIYEPRDILWALATRLDPDSIVLAPPRPDVFHGAYPAKRGIGIDATIPLSKKEAYKRPRFPTWIDLGKWIPSDVLEQAKSLQSDYAKMLARTGH